jgi:hypothetical protein
MTDIWGTAMKHIAALVFHALVCIIMLILIRNPLWLLAGLTASALVMYFALPSVIADPRGLDRIGDKLANVRAISDNKHFQMKIEGSDISDANASFNFADHHRTWLVISTAIAAIAGLFLKL